MIVAAVLDARAARDLQEIVDLSADDLESEEAE